MADEVGKVSLGLEIDSGDVERQLGSLGGRIGTELSKPLQNAFSAAFKSVDMSPIADSFGEALKASITAGASAAISTIQTQLNSLKMPNLFPASTMSRHVNPATPLAPTANVGSTAPIVNTTNALRDLGQEAERTAPKVKKSFNIIGGSLRALGGLAAGAFAIGGMITFGRTAIGLASDLQEVQNVVDVTFGAMAADVNAFADSALETFGLSELSAKRYASTMGAMLKSSGLTGASVRDLSIDMTKLAADFASFYNLNTDFAFDKIRSGIAGETEPLMQLGINMNVANMEAYALSQGITKSWQAMSQAEQVLLRYNYLLSVSKDAQGDFARNGQSWANQTRVLTEQWRIFQSVMGQGFINILTPVVRWLNVLIQKMQIAAQYFRALTEVLFGAQATAAAGATAATNAANAMGGIGEQADSATKGVKKAAKALSGLSGLDQFNLIKTTKDDSGDAAAGSAGAGGVDLAGMAMGELPTPDVNTDVFREKMQTLVSGTKQMFSGLWSDIKLGWGIAMMSLGPALTEAWGRISPELQLWKTSFQTVFNDIISLGTPLRDWITTQLIPVWSGAILLASGIWAGLSETVRTVFNDIWAAAFPVVEKLLTVWLPRFTEVVVATGEILGMLLSIVKQIFDDIWSGAIQPAMELVSKIIMDALDIIAAFWDTWGKGIIERLKTALDGIKGLWSNLWDNFLQPFITEMLEMLTWLWDKHLKGLVEEISNFVGKLTTAALDIWNKFIMPIVNYLVKNLGPTFSNVFSFIGDVIGTAVGVIADVLKGLLKSLGGVIDFIAGVFTGDWKRAWEGIQNFMQGFSDALVGIFKGAVNLIIDALNFMIRQINKIKIDVPSWVGKIPGIPDDISSVGFNIGEIPKLANGGVVSAPTLAMVGDNRNASIDPEVVSPLSKLQDMLAGSNAISDALLMSILDVLRDISRKDTTLEIDGTALARVNTRSSNAASRKSGRVAYTI
ncbi:hypothetical protein B1748_29145 [Paenibacillus sp. MY03]|uniref:phage tail protein n=1 Tax=Paenibacillus sp. MY03 TaxID=302980 RepID=UPI000B3C8779|nr:hypothetical protein [Paenibacillus sp. MY03]OUS70303.1 hypothetical protein B1748_29145 [Paenibacillus sp. MY03]